MSAFSSPSSSSSPSSFGFFGVGGLTIGFSFFSGGVGSSS